MMRHSAKRGQFVLFGRKATANLYFLASVGTKRGPRLKSTRRWRLMASEQIHDRDLYSGLIRLHMLHHAAKGPIFGLGMIEELARHGYRISPGTLYPLLRGLEKKGYLRSHQETAGARRLVFHATPRGKAALRAAKQRIRELFDELIRDK
jgi:DNA-binding PadR family transcriptional regulator